MSSRPSRSPDLPAISAALLLSPGWARVGLSMPQPEMRERAALELAASIVEHLAEAQDAPDPRQLPLF